MDEFSYSKAAKDHGAYESSSAFQQIATEAADVGRKLKLSSDDFEWGLDQLYDAYRSFPYAVNPVDRESEDHKAWYNHYRDARLGKKLGEPAISQDVLSGAACEYLKGSLRVPSFDRALLDAFIAQETFAYIDRRAGGAAFMTQFGCFGILIIGSLVWDLFFGTPNLRPYLRGLGIFLAIFFVVWAWPKMRRVCTLSRYEKHIPATDGIGRFRP